MKKKKKKEKKKKKTKKKKEGEEEEKEGEEGIFLAPHLGWAQGIYKQHLWLSGWGW